MSDHAELRRWVDHDAQIRMKDLRVHVRVLLDAAERAERAIELLRAIAGWSLSYCPDCDEATRDAADAFLAEVDRAE